MRRAPLAVKINTANPPRNPEKYSASEASSPEVVQGRAFRSMKFPEANRGLRGFSVPDLESAFSVHRVFVTG